MTDPIPCTAKQEPEFKELLNSLSYETSMAIELTNQIYYLTNNIQQIPEPDNKSEPIPKEPIGVIQMLWHEVFRLKDSNADLKTVMDHLQKLVGH